VVPRSRRAEGGVAEQANLEAPQQKFVRFAYWKASGELS
jgi:hypothetical protein